MMNYNVWKKLIVHQKTMLINKMMKRRGKFMNYGILTHIGFSKKGEKQNRIMSIGDVLECLAIRNIYQSMDVDENELITCYPYELATYQGEYCILPINVYSLNIDYSNRILPVFLGLALGG